MMTALDEALAYAARAQPVFPLHLRKVPYKATHGFKDATTDPALIRDWWSQWPHSLVGGATGHVSVVLDVDVKDGRNGFDTLAELGFASLPETPMAHTRSGGLHLHFSAPPFDIGCTVGNTGRGIGIGLDWRGLGGYVVLPSPGSGYWWDPHWNWDTVPLAKVPAELLPREKVEIAPGVAMDCIGLDAYGEAALESAIEKILAAPAGSQRMTLNNECLSIGSLAAAGGVPPDLALDVLLTAAAGLRSYDPKRPWRADQIAMTVKTAFRDGMARPRPEWKEPDFDSFEEFDPEDLADA